MVRDFIFNRVPYTTLSLIIYPIAVGGIGLLGNSFEDGVDALRTVGAATALGTGVGLYIDIRRYRRSKK